MQVIKGQYAMAEWNEVTALDAPPPHKCTKVDAHGLITGALSGEAKTFYLLSYVTAETGVYTGYTYFQGKIGDREGTLVFFDEGIFDPKSATTKWTIVPNSGTGGLKNIRGQGGFSATHGLTVDCFLEFEFG